MEKLVKEILFSKDTSENYQKFQELEQKCAESNVLYSYFDFYLQALHHKNSCVRGRGFKLILRNARWDTENKINQHLTEILSVLEDEKTTVVRQCLPLLINIGQYKKELLPEIREKIAAINYLKYKESMQSLIKRDIESLLTQLDSYS